MIENKRRSMQKFINQMERVLYESKSEVSKIRQGIPSVWNLLRLEGVIIPEIDELLFHAKNGNIYFKYGKKQRMLMSTYLLTDSIEGLSSSQLGVEILELQEIYNRL